jgi:hypothetical protein
MKIISNMLNLDKLSIDNLVKIQKFLEIVLDYIELFGERNSLIDNKIPLEKFKNKNINYYEALAIIKGLGNEVIEQRNEIYKRELSYFSSNTLTSSDYSNVVYMGFKNKEDYLKYFDITEEDLKNYIILIIRDLNTLKNIKKDIDEKLEKIAEDHKKEMVKQPKQLDENQKEQQPISEMNIKNSKPGTKVIDGKGYFKFYNEGENILIGGKDTRIFRLLQCLCEPFGVPKAIEAVFEAIRLPKDKNDRDLIEYSPQRKTRMLALIYYTQKELQKNKKLQKKIKFRYDSTKTSMWLKLEG